MKKSKVATSIAEALVVLTIIVLWLTWIYNIYSKSMDLTIAVENKIQAIQIAREWIEAVTNIRDTNWLVFTSDPSNCWKTLNYNDICVWESDPLSRIDINDGSYRVYRNTDNRWELDWWWAISWDYSNTPYREFYKIRLDSNWLYTQDWTWTDFNPVYTREIQVTTIDETSIDPNTWTPYYTQAFEWLMIKSIVYWSEEWRVRNVSLETIITNYKK